MLRFRRPTEPLGFGDSVLEAEATVHQQIAEGERPQFDEALWRQHKDRFIAAQHDKCGYCETFAINHPGSVEHYAPKSRVDELVEEGREEIPGVSVAGRKTKIVCATGYWWRAYSWENWLYACERCNTGWKRNLFPVREVPRSSPPRREVLETELLLGPFGNIDPVEHLAFSRLGQIYARDASDIGTATIQTCGLDRESLRRVREPIAHSAFRYAERLVEAIHEGDFKRAHEACTDLLALGAERRAHAGMVRAIVLSELRRSWESLQQLNEELELLASSQRMREGE